MGPSPGMGSSQQDHAQLQAQNHHHQQHQHSTHHQHNNQQANCQTNQSQQQNHQHQNNQHQHLHNHHHNNNLAGQQQTLINRQIYETFLRARQSNETYIQKARLREKLYNILRKCFKNPIDLYIVGSSINNLGNNNSDVDMCLIISDRDIDQTTEALPILQFVRDQINQYDFVRKSNLIMAKVPLLRFEDATSDVVVDLNVNNSVGIRNTHLINCYTRRKYMKVCIIYIYPNNLCSKLN